MKSSLKYKKHQAEKHKINLDLPPSQRYTALCQKFKSAFQSFQKEYEDSLIKTTFKNSLSFYNKFKEKALFYLRNSAPKEYKEELEGMAISLEVDLGYLLAYNFIYELRTLACTTILSFDPKGKMNMTSNLDFCYDEFYSKMTVQAIFEKNKEVVYEGNFIFGFAGFSRGYKNGISVALNARSPKRLTEKSRKSGEISAHIEELFKKLDEGKILQMVYYFRKCLEEATDFEDLAHKLKNGNLGAPVYFILTDGEQGLVIERSPDGVDFEEKILKKSKKIMSFQWIFGASLKILSGVFNPLSLTYMIGEMINYSNNENIYIQTNYDKKSKDLDGRRDCAYKRLKGRNYVIGREEIIEEVMGKKPNFMMFNMDKESHLRLRTISTSYVGEDDQYKVVLWLEEED